MFGMLWEIKKQKTTQKNPLKAKAITTAFAFITSRKQHKDILGVSQNHQT